MGGDIVNNQLAQIIITWLGKTYNDSPDKDVTYFEVLRFLIHAAILLYLIYSHEG